MAFRGNKTKKPLPKLWCVTDRHLLDRGRFLQAIQEACESDLPALLLREKDLEEKEFETLAAQVTSIGERTKTKVVINVGSSHQALVGLAAHPALCRWNDLCVHGFGGQDERWVASLAGQLRIRNELSAFVDEYRLQHGVDGVDPRNSHAPGACAAGAAPSPTVVGAAHS